MKNTTPSGTRTLQHLQAVGAHRRFDHLADRIGQRRDLVQASRNFVDPLAIEQESVDLRLGQAKAGAAPMSFRLAASKSAVWLRS